MKKIYIALSSMLLFAVSNIANAQLNYPVSNFQVTTGTYTDLGTTGSAISVGNTNDANSAPVPIGFTFNYNGVSYNEFVLNTNGVIKLGTVAPSTAALYTASATNGGAGTGGPFNTTDSNMIAAFCHDLIGATGAEYRVLTSGNVGSRVCTIQFKNLTENTTTPAVQYATINFQIKLYETTNIIEIIYGTFTSTTNSSAFKSAVVGLKGSSTVANQIVAITKGSVTAWNLATALLGNYTGNNFNFGNNVGSSPRPMPVPGVTYRFIPTYPTDLAIRQVYTLGKLPIPFATPHTIRAAVRNSGTNSLANLKVYLMITGANPFLDSVSITGMNPNVDSIIAFSPFIPSIVGRNFIKVYTNADNNVFNDTAYYTQDVNLNTYNYADPTQPSAGGVGFTGATGDFVAKFNYTGSNAINQIGVNFNTGGTTLKVGIWDTTTAGTPGTKLWESPTFLTQAGLNTIPVNPPIPINGTFFVGVIQTGTTNAAFSFQFENPIRNQTFYYTSPTGNTTWTDFFATSSNFRFMIEPRLQVANDIGFTSIIEPCNAIATNKGPVVPQAQIFNYGSFAQSNFMAYCRVRNNQNSVVHFDSVFVTNFLAPNSSGTVTFTNSLNLTIPGNYTVQVWSNLFNDADNNNDTALQVITVTPVVSKLSAGTCLRFDGVDDMVLINNHPTLNPSSAFTIEAWVLPTNQFNTGTIYSKDSNFTNISHNLTLNGYYPSFSVRTGSGVVTLNSNDSVNMLNWNHIAAVYNGTSMTLYVNGDTAGTISQSGSVINYNVPAYLGRFAGAFQPSSALIDNVRIWNVARSQAEIIENMHNNSSFAFMPGLVLDYKFNGGVNSSLVNDESANCNTGVLMNMDIANQTTTPAWFISSLPVDTTPASIVTISTTGLNNITGKNMSVNYHNISGTQSLAVNYIRNLPNNILPDSALTGGSGFKTSHNRYWVVYSYGNATYDSIQAIFNVLPGQLSFSPVLSDLYLTERRSGAFGIWSVLRNPASGVNTSNNTIQFTLASNQQIGSKQLGLAAYNNPLPVKYLYLNALANQHDAYITWATSSEINNKGFYVLRSKDGENFETIGFVAGKGSSNNINKYKFVDFNAGLYGKKLYYKLIQTDFDGNNEESNVLVVLFDENNGFEITSVSPNPFISEFNINVSASQSDNIKIELFNVNGKCISKEDKKITPGFNTLVIDQYANLVSGIYYLKISISGETKTYKLVKM